ncbi:hypothetical protein LTR29_001480 [Friedmanniomyces endolithicus]|nr:hypothetical protein LTR29_001480 [Friedmanniomyces endolithicus]
MLHEELQKGPRNDIPIPWLKTFEFESRRWRVRWRILEVLGKQFKLTSPWKRSMINFFTLISFTEAVRLKCGSREGLLSFMLTPLEWIIKALVHNQYPPAPVPAPQPKMSHDEDLAQRLEMTATTGESGNVSYDLSRLNAAPGAGEPSAYLDTSLQAEGLNWCVDLTAPDPTFILPILLWLSVSANIIFQGTAGRPMKVAVPTSAKAKDAASQSPELKPDQTFDSGAVSPEALNTLTAPAYGSNNSDKRFLGFLPPVTNLQRNQLCIVLAIMGAMLKIPAAIFLYWIPSLAIGAVQRRWLAAKFPLRPPIQPCRRPLRGRVKKPLWQRAHADDAAFREFMDSTREVQSTPSKQFQSLNTTDQQVALGHRISISGNGTRRPYLSASSRLRPYTCAIKNAYDTALAVIAADVTILFGDTAGRTAYSSAKDPGPATATMTINR